MALAASPFLPAREASYSEQMPDMLLTHLSGKLNALAAKWDLERANIRTSADLETRNRFVQIHVENRLVLGGAAARR